MSVSLLQFKLIFEKWIMFQIATAKKSKGCFCDFPEKFYMLTLKFFFNHLKSEFH